VVNNIYVAEMCDHHLLCNIAHKMHCHSTMQMCITNQKQTDSVLLLPIFRVLHK